MVSFNIASKLGRHPRFAWSCSNYSLFDLLRLGIAGQFVNGLYPSDIVMESGNESSRTGALSIEARGGFGSTKTDLYAAIPDVIMALKATKAKGGIVPSIEVKDWGIYGKKQFSHLVIPHEELRSLLDTQVDSVEGIQWVGTKMSSLVDRNNTLDQEVMEQTLGLFGGARNVEVRLYQCTRNTLGELPHLEFTFTPTTPFGFSREFPGGPCLTLGPSFTFDNPEDQRLLNALCRSLELAIPYEFTDSHLHGFPIQLPSWAGLRGYPGDLDLPPWLGIENPNWQQILADTYRLFSGQGWSVSIESAGIGQSAYMAEYTNILDSVETRHRKTEIYWYAEQDNGEPWLPFTRSDADQMQAMCSALGFDFAARRKYTITSPVIHFCNPTPDSNLYPYGIKP